MDKSKNELRSITVGTVLDKYEQQLDKLLQDQKELLLRGQLGVGETCPVHKIWIEIRVVGRNIKKLIQTANLTRISSK